MQAISQGPPILRLGTLILPLGGQGPAADVDGGLLINGAVQVVIPSTATFALAGDFTNHATDPLLFDWATGPLTLDGTIQDFELAGEDRGPNELGFIDNFAIDTLNIAAGTSVDFIDTFDNFPGAGCEALYVRTLNLAAGSIIRLSGCNVYYLQLIIEGAPEIQNVSGGSLQAIRSADLDGDNDIDGADFAIFVNAFGGCSEDPNSTIGRSDFDGDGCVTFVDYQIWLLLYREQKASLSFLPHMVHF